MKSKNKFVCENQMKKMKTLQANSDLERSCYSLLFFFNPECTIFV